MSPIRTLIMGAAGRDFHNFNVVFRDNPDYEVVAFTATQIPDIEGRTYPAAAGRSAVPGRHPDLCRKRSGETDQRSAGRPGRFRLQRCARMKCVMHKASLVLAAGADFRLMGTNATQIKSTKPVVSVCAVRTGSGKSQTTRRVSLILRDMGYKVAAIRHPMPYGDLVKQAVQRYRRLQRPGQARMHHRRARRIRTAPG